MQKLGVSPLYINFIKTLYTNNTSTIINNGFLSSPISLERGLRQGCPLSLPLYIIHGEVTTKNINNDDSIIGIKITNVFNFFENLKKATGTTINLEKTTLLPINTDNTLQIQATNPQISIKEQYESTKILRYNNKRRLKICKTNKLAKHHRKNGNHINKLTPRLLPLQRKVILLNTLILSKTSYLSNIFPLDNNTTSKIHKIIFKYL